MPMYAVEQIGVPGLRIVEADKPQQALNHVIDQSFTVRRIYDRELLDLAKQYGVETAGVHKPEPEHTHSGNDCDGDEPSPVAGQNPEPASNDVVPEVSGGDFGDSKDEEE